MSLTFASITASILLFARGKKLEGLFVGLWPPTLQALKAASAKGQRAGQRTRRTASFVDPEGLKTHMRKGGSLKRSLGMA